MFTTQLTKGERKIIKKIASLQLESLRGLIHGDSETDLTLYCLQDDLDKDRVIAEMHKSITKFEELENNPENVLMLDDNNLSITRHILFNYFNGKRHKESKRLLWRKLFTKENYIGNLN